MRYFRKWIAGYGVILAMTLLIAHWSSRAVTVFSENSPVQRQRTIIIDAGHGGVDGGASSGTGIPESQINLQISLRLNDLFHFIGYKTKMIRTEDISVYKTGRTIAQKKASDLKERVRIVNETDNGLLLSIHQNYYSDKQYSGAQVFYTKTAGSQQLAKELQVALVKYANPGSKRKEKRSSGIYLMKHIQCPGVLIECGFLSNPEEDAKLLNEDYQKMLCSVIAVTVGDYLSNT